MMKASPSGAVLIGDSPRRDIEPCRNLGIRTVYARYVARFSHDRTEFTADFTIDTMNDLPDILRRLS